MCFIFVLWSIGSGYYYVCHVKQACANPLQTEIVLQEPIQFTISEEKPTLGTDFETWKNEILAKQNNDNQLQIVGLYSSAEVNNSIHRDLGIARAVQVQEALGISVEEVIIESRQTEIDWSKTYAEAIEFEYVIKNKNVIENDFGAVLILSPYAVPEEVPVDIMNYLKEICKHAENQVIDIVGYSPELNDVAENYSQGYHSANLIRDIFAEQGYPSELLNVASEGSRRDNLSIDFMPDSVNLVEVIIR